MKIKSVLEIALQMYLGEQCRICGKKIQPEDLNDLIFAGYSADSSSRYAHKECWDKNIPKEQWAFPPED
jgi:hypothetical protein